MLILVLQRLLIDAVLDIVYFPLWWYTGGAKRSLFWCLERLRNGNRALAPGLWLKNIFVPMYGQWDWQGRIISFFMRLVQVVFRTIALAGWFLVCIFLWALWLILPIVVVAGLVNRFSFLLGQIL